jgi:hypothetical protein
MNKKFLLEKLRKIFSGSSCRTAQHVAVGVTGEGMCKTDETAKNIDPENADDSALWESVRRKWKEIPATLDDRGLSSDFDAMTDDELLRFWNNSYTEQTTGPGYGVRGWYQDRYAPILKGKQVCEIGSGMGFDGIHFALKGAHLTFVDIVPENLKLVRRICQLKGITADYLYMDDPFSYVFPSHYDSMLMIGSLINVPFDFARKEIENLISYLRTDGAVLFLGYPRERFIMSGAADGAAFAKTTDGEGTPWIEWYDATKVLDLFGKDRFEIAFQVPNFGRSNFEFNWFEMRKKF